MQRPPHIQTKILAALFLSMLSESARRACTVSALLFDDNVMAMGLTINDTDRRLAAHYLNEVQGQVAGLLKRPARIKWMQKGAWVLLPLKPAVAHYPTHRPMTVAYGPPPDKTMP